MAHHLPVAAFLLNISLILSLGYLFGGTLRIDHQQTERRWIGTGALVTVFSGIAMMQSITPLLTTDLTYLATQTLCVALAVLYRGLGAGAVVAVISAVFSVWLGFRVEVSPLVQESFRLMMSTVGAWTLASVIRLKFTTNKGLHPQLIHWKPVHFALLGGALGLNNLVWCALSYPVYIPQAVTLIPFTLAVMVVLALFAGAVVQRELITHRDALQKHESEIAIRESEQRYRLLAEHAHDLVMLSRINGLPEYISPSAERMLGYAIEELDGPTCQSLYHPDDTLNLFAKAYRPLLSGQQPEPVQYRMRHRDGHYIWLETRAVPVINAHNQPTHYVTVSRDISEQMIETTRRRESEMMYKRLASHLPDGAVAILDRDLRYLLADGPALTSLGLSQEQIIGQTVRDIFYPPFQNFILPICEQALAGDNISLSVIFAGRYYETYLTPIYGADGNITSVMMFAFNVSARRKAELNRREIARERQRTRIITQFMRDISHEFRTPLSIIQTYAQLLQTQPNSPTPLYVDRIVEGSHAILHLIDSLEVMTQLDSHATFRLSPQDVNDVVRFAFDQVRDRMKDRAPQMRLELNADPLNAEIDNFQLRQAIYRLIENAIHYTPPEGTVCVQTGREGDHVVIDIIDTGIGIAPEHVPHIFERLYRVEKAQSTRGFGLGLPIAQKIVEEHHGYLTVQTRLGKGSIFRITLPAKEPTHQGVGV